MTIAKQIQLTDTPGKTSNQHVSHGQAYNQVHAASAKASVLYKKNDGKEIHRYYSNKLGGEYGKPDDTLGWWNNHVELFSSLVWLFLDFVLLVTFNL